MKMLYHNATKIFVCPAYKKCDHIFGGQPNCPHAIDHVFDRYACICPSCHDFEDVQCREMEG